MSAPSWTDQSAARRWRLMTGRNGTNYWNSRRLPGGGGVVGFSSVSAGNNRLSQANTRNGLSNQRPPGPDWGPAVTQKLLRARKQPGIV